MKTSSNTIRTAGNARDEKNLADARSEHRALLVQNRLSYERSVLARNPSIGILTRKGKAIFYVTTAGKQLESADIDVITRALSTF